MRKPRQQNMRERLCPLEASRIRFRPSSGRNFSAPDSHFDTGDPNGQAFDHVQFETAVSAGLASAFLFGLDRSKHGVIIPAHRPPRRGHRSLHTVPNEPPSNGHVCARALYDTLRTPPRIAAKGTPGDGSFRHLKVTRFSTRGSQACDVFTQFLVLR